jgi:hypothetical protein
MIFQILLPGFATERPSRNGRLPVMRCTSRRAESEDGPGRAMAGAAWTEVRSWPIATGAILTASRRFRGIADMAGPAACPARSR